MDLKRALDIQEDLHVKRRNVRISKGQDYAGKEDCLRNFKERAMIIKLLRVDTTTSYGIAIEDMILKLQRTCNLLFPVPKKAENETLFDTVAIDMPNYNNLLVECLVDAGLLDLSGKKQHICASCGSKIVMEPVYQIKGLSFCNYECFSQFFRDIEKFKERQESIMREES